jgi:uncharacterized protein YegL
VADSADLWARGLSSGRRRSARLLLGGSARFWTDLVDIYVPWPLPAAASEDELTLMTCVALQAAPTKEVLAGLHGLRLSWRELLCLQYCEGAAAAGWVRDEWPGLRDHLRAALPHIEPARWRGISADELVAQARAMAKRESKLPDLPLELGAIPLGSGNESAFTRAVRRIGSLPRPLAQALERFGGMVPALVDIPSSDEENRLPLDAGPQFDEEPRSQRSPTGLPYPEWDVFTHAYRTDFTTVTERRFPCRAAGAGPIRPELDAWLNAPIERRRQGRLADGGDIDIDAVVDASVDLATGHDPGVRFYVDRLRVARDVSCALLLDMSGSLGQAELLHRQLECADALSDAMARAGERYAVYAFRSQGPKHVEVDVLAPFSDGLYRPNTAGLRPAHATRLGAAVRHVVAQVRRQPSERKVVIVLTDGVPFDEGYEGHYANADVEKALDEAESQGVAVMIIGIAVADGDELAEVLGDRWRQISGVDELAPVLGDVHNWMVAS